MVQKCNGVQRDWLVLSLGHNVALRLQRNPHIKSGTCEMGLNALALY